MFHETARTNPVRSTSRIAALHVARMFGLQSRRGNISDPGSYKSMRLDPDGLYCNVFLSAFTGPKWWKISKTRREGKARRAWYQAKTQKTSDLTEPNRPHERREKLIWKKIEEAQIAGDDILARILLRAYGDLDSSSRPALVKTCLADPVLLTVDQGSIASAIAKGKTQMEDGIIYAVGTVFSHQYIGFVPFFDENIKELKAPLPLTIFDRGE
ncbi:hypothetical protein KEM48_000561 [Puccinia striiformis f. sp. tritici PST-130]|nr:hypothetical protein KEM48_000561 [Puccinia striiformis f. sp. tritici PST-130]